MRDIDPEGLIISVLKGTPGLAGIPIYAGWPGWDMPPETEITTSVINTPVDNTQDATGETIVVSTELNVNIWAPTETEARETTVKVHDAINHLRIDPSEGAEIWVEVEGFRPAHEIDANGALYRFVVDVQVKTQEAI